jgi:thiol:disulfide interchange protein DsbA
MRSSIYALLFLSLSLVSCTSEAGFEAGKHYVELGVGQPVSADGKIEVREFFWYGCPHCYRLEPYLEAWLEKRPVDVAYVRTPGVARSWISHAKAYYAFEALGITEKVHRPFFDAIHKGGQKLADESSIKVFLADYGVDGESFRKAFNSFGVRTQVEKAKQLNFRYGVESVPSVTIGGKYKTSASMAGSEGQLMQLIDHLIEKIRQQR